MKKRKKVLANKKQGRGRKPSQQLSSAIVSLIRAAARAFENGDITGAFEIARKALRSSKQHPETLKLVGGLHLRAGEYNSAITCFKKALLGSPGDHQILVNLGEAYCACRQFQDAIKIYEKLFELYPRYENCLVNFGTALMGAGEPERAEKILTEALNMDPGSLVIRSNLALLAKQMGQKDEAILLLRGALEIEPSDGELHYNLAMSKTFTSRDRDIVSMERAKGVSEYGTENRMFLGFALGKAYEDCKKFDLAIKNLQEANEFWRGRNEYNVQEDLDKLNRIENFFPAGLFANHKGLVSKSPKKTPIFILGMPRSGTSLVEQIVSAHSEVFGGGELPLLQDLAFNYHINGKKVSGSGSNRIGFPGYMQEFKSKQLLELGQRYLERLPDPSKGYSFVTDKMPSNYQLIGLIRLILPHAKVIHCRRLPLDTCFSCYSLHFPYGQEFSYDLNDLAKYYKGYNGLMNHWGQELGDWFYNVTYEELIENPEEETQKLVDFCGLEWEDRCLEFYNSKRQVETASAIQVRQPIYKSAVNRWRNFEGYLNGLVRELGPLADAL